MKAKDFLSESQYQQYRMLFELDPSRRDFLKKLGKGAAGVAGAAALSALPTDAQAGILDKIPGVNKLTKDKEKEQQDPSTFSKFAVKGLRFGMNKDTVKQIKKNDPTMLGGGLINDVVFSSLLGVSNVGVRLAYENDLLFGFKIQETNEDIEKFIAVLRRKFGNPAEDKRGTVRTKNGATWPFVRVAWTNVMGDGYVLAVTRHGRDINYGTLQMVPMKYFRAHLASKEKDAQDSTKDF